VGDSGEGSADQTHVSVPGRAGRESRPGIEIHRPRTLDTDIRHGIPVTSLTQTLLDLTRYDQRQLKSYLRQSERLHKLDVPAFADTVDALPPSSPKGARWRRILREYVPDEGLTESDLEAAFFELCAKYGIPAPTLQRTLGTKRLDFYWDDVNLIVEVDGRESHDTHVAYVEDRRRDRELKAQGHEVIRFAYSEIVGAPFGAAKDVQAARARLAKQ
jgi:hypothetical protein